MHFARVLISVGFVCVFDESSMRKFFVSDYFLNV